MRQHRKKAYAVGIAVALGAGVVGPASAGTDGGADSRGPGRAPAQAGPPHRAQLGPAHRLTLVTGDRVTVDSKGRLLGFAPAEGREHIPVRTRTVGGHALVVPYDAQRLIAEGRVDQRLFDVSELTAKANRRAQKRGLKLIVGYAGAARGAKAGVRAVGDTAVRRSLPSLNADAITTPKADAAALWRTLTERRGTRTAVASGVSRLWLDGTRKASLDKSVKQIGAPKAWEAGYDGKGVKIAVLDTGVDATHPDLKNQVVAAKDFTSSPDTKDRVGHGTHVASTVAGTGAKSGGRFKGVAPGAKVLNGKVLGDDGSGDDSGIIAGIDWAAAQGADVVNLSLGADDFPGVDPLEAAVDKVSARKGILFAVASGNGGEDGPGSVDSPGSAAAALTVGAVDDHDRLADFSGRGPSFGDGAIKPDVTAPGVDITAAAAPGSEIDKQVGQQPQGYLTISGTSMATPHVAGAAALLKQQHPDWKQPQLKGALTASTEAGKYTAFQQGSGRVAADRALKQTVVADPVSLDYGLKRWPHADDKPATKKVTYRNLGAEDVTLDLAVTATDPKGRPAPDGFFTLGANKVTVPAGGKATVGLTAHTKVGGTDGAYAAYVVASGGGQRVRSAAAVEREVESYDLTLKTLGRDGRPTPHYVTALSHIRDDGHGLNHDPYDKSGTVEIRVPKGHYLLDSTVYVDPDNADKGTDWLVRPKLIVDRRMTVTVDARKARPVRITVPDRAAKLRSADARISYKGYGLSAGGFTDFSSLRTAHLGPAITDGSLGQQWHGEWEKGADTAYQMVLGRKVGRLATGYTQHLKAGDFATVKAGMGASAPGRTGGLTVFGVVPGTHVVGRIPEAQKLPRTKTLHLSALGRTQWMFEMEQYDGVDEDGEPVTDAFNADTAPHTFKAGKSYRRTFNTAVFGPRVGAVPGPDLGIFRKGDRLKGNLPLAADGTGRPGWSDYASSRSVLYRDGRKIAETTDPLSGAESFRVPAADARYRLTVSARRAAEVARVSSRVDASWTFRSKKVREETLLPASTVRFTPKVGLDSRAPAGATRSVPVTVQGAAAGENLKSLSAYVSYDKGRTWKKAAVRDGKISVTNPARGKSISFRAAVEDKKGNKATVAIYDAYFGK
ncbi:S8 family serine peptidase [Streptomyces lasiicapitis]|uniref:S8 family peptidase n=1 Tax=Streptomyces lasiicapitis TaxID=1923961 RepID=UPI00332C195F